jgi:alcohol dehydrogenase class IV
VRRLLAEVGFPTCAEAGVADADIEALVALARDDYCLTVSPHTWTDEDIRRAYADALALGSRGSPSNT